MSTKSKANVSVVQGQIPEISQYLVEGDPNDPSSKPLFMPWKAALDREGSFKMSHKAVKASVDFGMINNGDKIIMGISG